MPRTSKSASEITSNSKTRLEAQLTHTKKPYSALVQSIVQAQKLPQGRISFVALVLVFVLALVLVVALVVARVLALVLAFVLALVVVLGVLALVLALVVVVPIISYNFLHNFR